jgi:uncharacterized protein involved in exopolysaccharide biosynthesis
MQQNPQKQEDEISLREFIEKFREIASYLLKKWIVILIVGIIGGGIGFTYAFLQPIKFQSRLSFVVEDNKSSAGGLAAIAGQFGFDIGGSGSGGVFSGDNILLFLKSESLCWETLLSNFDSSGKITLADRYAEVNELKKSWLKNKKIGEINFNGSKERVFSRLEDSLLQSIVKRILKNDLKVDKPNKKASFIEVTVEMRDESISKLFNERLVKIATDRYVDSKIKVKALNVSKLQRRADSLGALLNARTYSAATSQQSLVDLNPALKVAPVEAEISGRDKTIIATIFAEVVKNLEIAKVSLSQETPTIQLVDSPILPLKRLKTSKLFYLIVAGAIMGIITILILLIKKQLQ